MSSNTDYMLSDITGEGFPWEERDFPPIQPSRDHVVLYKVSTGSRAKPPVPHKRKDILNYYLANDHVWMPHSNKNDKESSESRWAIIQKSLEKILEQPGDTKALIKAILKYNGKFKNVWKFKALEYYLDTHLTKEERDDFFKQTLPGIIKLALQLPDLVQAPIPLLKQNQCRSVSLSQQQIASLLANAFLCTFPGRNTASAGANRHSVAAKLPRINFASLYESPEGSVFQKLRCICNYFRRVSSKMPTGVVTFSRRFVYPFGCPSWETSDDLIKGIPVYVDSQHKIEDAEGLIHVDFANKLLGGGVLGSGLVQEEIRFLICPELMAAMIFTELLGPQEALMIIGCERYNNYRGYGHGSFQWGGNHNDGTPVDSSGRRRCAVLAIDAEQYFSRRVQFYKNKIERELNKAWIGFSFFEENSNPNHLRFPGVATGNWGCGVFNGDPQLKSLIQVMAATVAKRPLAYFTFGDQHFKKEVENVYNLCRRFDVTVGELFKSIAEYDYEKDLYSFLKEKLDEKLTRYRSVEKTYPTRPENEKRRHSQECSLLIDLKAAGTSTKDDHPQNVASERCQRYDPNRSQKHQGYHPNIPKTHQGDHPNRSQNRPQNVAPECPQGDDPNRSQKQKRDDYKESTNYRYSHGEHSNRSQTHQGDQKRYDYNESTNNSNTHGQPQHPNRSQTHQGHQKRDDYNECTNYGPHGQPQNIPCSSKNDAKPTPSNFQSSKNYGRGSKGFLENGGKRCEKASSSYGNHSGPPQSQHTMNNEWRPNQETSGRVITPGSMTTLFSSVVKRGLLSSQIYKITGNERAVMMRMYAESSSGADQNQSSLSAEVILDID